MPRFIDRLRSTRFIYVWVVTVITFVALGGHGAQAHKAVTSKYGYNEDIFPIFRDRCGRCHVSGGPAPMSLLTYREAIPWAESIREELTTEQMPPWYVDPAGPAVRGGHPISAREIDMIINWASGDILSSGPPPTTRYQLQVGIDYVPQ